MRLLTECHNAILWADGLRVGLFKSKNLGYLVLLAAMMSVAVGVVLYLVDGNIHSPQDGVWSAWVTMTHVGFGDVVPVSLLGRVLAAGLILFGLVLFSLFTALISVTLIGRNTDPLDGTVVRVAQDESNAHDKEGLILAELARLHERMAALEKQWVAAGAISSEPASSASSVASGEGE